MNPQEAVAVSLRSEREIPESRGCGSVPELKVESEWGGVELVEAVAEEWRQLCLKGPCNQPFYRPEWIAAAIRAFAGEKRLLLITAWNGDRLRAVLPLLEHRGWAYGMPCVRLHTASRIPRFEFVHGNTDVAEAVSAVWQHLQNLPGWDVIELINVPGGGAAERLEMAAREDAFPTSRYEYAQSPYILLKGNVVGGDFWRFGRSSRFRYQLRQKWRELGEFGALRLQRTDKADPETLERFYRLERSGWKGREGTAILSKPELRQFYDGVARCAEQFGYLSIYFLELGNTAVAAHLALTYGGAYYPIKVAYDERFSKYGPGHLIIGSVLNECVAHGLSEFDCLGEKNAALTKWTTAVHIYNSCSIFRNSVRGRMLRAAHGFLHGSKQALQTAARSARSFSSRTKRWFSGPPQSNPEK